MVECMQHSLGTGSQYLALLVGLSSADLDRGDEIHVCDAVPWYEPEKKAVGE